MAKKHIVSLTDDERSRLRRQLAVGTSRPATQTRARILPKADQSAGGTSWSDQQIAEALDVRRADRRTCA